MTELDIRHKVNIIIDRKISEKTESWHKNFERAKTDWWKEFASKYGQYIVKELEDVKKRINQMFDSYGIVDEEVKK